MNLIVKRSYARKRLCLQYCAYEGLKVLAPAQLSQEYIDQFILEQQHWIARQMEKHDRSFSAFKDLHQVYYLGQTYQVLTDAAFQEELKLDPDNLDTKEKRKEQIRIAFERKAQEFLSDRLAYWVEVSGLKPKALHLKWLRSRWGSCSSQKNINLNRALIGAPKAYIDYVIVHELCHLEEMNHSKQFWDCVQSLYPNIKAAKSWLREHQAPLMVLCRKD